MTEKRELFNTFFSEQLNQTQQKVVQQKDGILLVCAGAGSGKTRVITSRITNLILNEDVDSSEVIALTFTNKAAREMQERVTSFLPQTIKLPYVGTFHSYCLKLLKMNQNLLDIPNFSILDDGDQKKLLKKIIHDHGVQKRINEKQASYAISRAKNASVTGFIDEKMIGDHILYKIYQLYEQEKKKSHCFDFDDLLIETLKLFSKNPDFKTHYQSKIRHILVDEYQDTNHVQHALLKALSCNEKKQFNLDSLCVVGDEDQSIYSWRGATVSNIVDFKKDFPSTLHITIEQNYRSAKPILEAANHIIKNNIERNPKKLWSTKKGSDRIRIVQANSGYHEADIISSAASAVLKQKDNNSCAVLYRSHYQSRTIEEMLLRNSIPYKIIGGIQFYERLEIKDLLAYLRLAANPFDRVSFLRSYNTPSRGLGAKFEELFFEQWEQEPFLRFHELAQKLIDAGIVKGTKALKLKQFIEVFKDINANSNTLESLEKIIKRIGYLTYLHDAFSKEEATAKTENVKELLNGIQSAEKKGTQKLNDFLDEVSLLQEKIADAQDQQNCLNLMTLHAAKGLEFDTVILTGLEEGLFPSSRSTYEASALEEERRLLYVGVTRARERLLVTHARTRYSYGQINDQLPSRFIEEFPEEHIQIDDGRQWRNHHINAYTMQWIQGNTATNYFSENFNFTPNKTENLIKKHNWDSAPFKNEAEASIKKLQKKWKLYQPVRHQKFGTGVIEKIEKKDTQTTYLTIKFTSGSKKIDAKFVQTL